jgi:hypothetical protein
MSPVSADARRRLKRHQAFVRQPTLYSCPAVSRHCSDEVAAHQHEPNTTKLLSSGLRPANPIQAGHTGSASR